jgi:isopentenyl-diphosphate delta-isomerase
VESAVRRRLGEELSLPVRDVAVVLPDFSYRAVSPEGMVEHEVCPVLVARADDDPRPDPEEVVEWRWVDWSAFRDAATSAPWLLSPWSVLQVAQLPADLDRSVVAPRH